MAGGFIRKPYERALARATEAQPEIKEELILLSKPIQAVIIPFLRPGITLDDFHEMAVICLEEMKEPNKKAISSAQKRIRDHFREERHKQRILYNPSRNISLNECIGESKTPVSEWLNVAGWREWDDN